MAVVELLPNGAIILTQTDIDARRSAMFDFYVYASYTVAAFMATVFFIYQDVPNDFRTTFVWVVTALTIVSFRAGLAYAVMHRWMRP